MRVRETVLGQRPERLEEKIFRLVPIDAYQTLSGLDVDARGSDPLVERQERALREFCVTERRTHCPVQRVAAVVIGTLRVGTTLEQRLDERHVAGRARC